MQRVSGEDGVGLPKHLVARGFSAAKIVVIHAREIVVNQRVCMQHFNAAGGGQGCRAVSAGYLAEFYQQQRTYSLSSGKKGVAHGVQKLLLRTVRRKI